MVLFGMRCYLGRGCYQRRDAIPSLRAVVRVEAVCLILWFKKLIFICFLISALLLYFIVNDSLNGSSLRPVMKTAI